MTTPLHGQRHRAESFGSVAQEYDAVRPTYPDALFDDLAALAPRHVLDVGCGTGRAALPLIARGLDVLGVEIDAQMAGVARAHGVPVEVAPFETWDAAGRRFELIVSGQAWHWIDPSVGLPKAAALLRPGGTLALFWNVAEVTPEVQQALDRVYREHALDLMTKNAGRTADPGYAPEVRTAGLFATVETRGYPWQHTYTSVEWIRMVQTHSDHVVLDPDRRAVLLAAAEAALDALGGQVVTSYKTHTVLATMP
jgi:SAM-dependent methyltransferase